MAKSFTLDWHGEDLKKRVSEVAKANVLKSAVKIKKNAFGLAPVDTGGYRESIEYKTWNNKGVFGAYVESGEPGLEHLARFIELGTPGEFYTGGSYKGQKRTPIPAKPHLRPALNQEKKAFLNSFRDAL